MFTYGGNMNYITPIEAATRLGVSRATIYKWVREGHLQSVQVNEGRAIMIVDDGLNIYTEKNRDLEEI